MRFYVAYLGNMKSAITLWRITMISLRSNGGSNFVFWQSVSICTIMYRPHNRLVLFTSIHVVFWEPVLGWDSNETFRVDWRKYARSLSNRLAPSFKFFVRVNFFPSSNLYFIPQSVMATIWCFSVLENYTSNLAFNLKVTW